MPSQTSGSIILDLLYISLNYGQSKMKHQSGGMSIETKHETDLAPEGRH